MEDQFYLLLPLLLSLGMLPPKAAIVIPGIVFVTGLALRALLAYLHPGAAGGVSARAFQLWIYYPTWTRLDPLMAGVLLAGTKIYRPRWWQCLLGIARWLGFLGLVAIVGGLAMGEGQLTVATCVWQFPLIAFGMSTLLICALSPALPFRRIEIPGAALLASIAYSVYLSHKLVIHAFSLACARLNLPLSSLTAFVSVQILIYAGGSILFLGIERPFLQLRQRLTRQPLSPRQPERPHGNGPKG